MPDDGAMPSDGGRHAPGWRERAAIRTEPGIGTTHCPFDFSENLAFDPLLAELMARGPVTRIRLPHGDCDAWLVTSYDGVRQVTTDARFSRAAIVGRDYPRLTPEPIVSPESINVIDPPRSRRLRQAAAQAFTKQRVRRMTPAIERVTGALLDEMAAHGPPADLVHHLSNRLPHHTICELLGVPAADRPLVLHHTQQLLNVAPTAQQVASQAKQHLRHYFTQLVHERRRQPGDDLVSTLAATKEPLADEELAVLAMTLLLSGIDTTTCQISDITYTLLTRPDHWQALVRRPGQLPRTLDELLRCIPFRKGVGIPRIALEDVEMEGTLIGAGDFVHVSYLAANRDPAVFPDPHTFDPERPAHPHMTFGWGGHHCIAASLAFEELRVALSTLLARFPGLRLAVPRREVRWDSTTIRRFPLHLPVTW